MTAPPVDLAAFEPTHLMCRYMRHAWVFEGIWQAPDDDALVALAYCRDCHAVREQDLTAAGAILRTRYHYPAGYLQRGIGRRVMPLDVRQEVMRRNKPKKRGLDATIDRLTTRAEG